MTWGLMLKLEAPTEWLFIYTPQGLGWHHITQRLGVVFGCGLMAQRVFKRRAKVG